MSAKPKVDPNLFEEDDEFEEFPTEGRNERVSILCLCWVFG